MYYHRKQYLYGKWVSNCRAVYRYFDCKFNNHLISGNCIGGSAPLCGGTDPFTVTGSTAFTGISSSYTDVPIITIQGNTIQKY